MKDFFKIYKNTTVFILSIRSVTGGPDALHQLSYYLNQLGYNSKMAYLYTNGPEDCDAPDEYKCYDTKGIIYDDIVDDAHNIVIIPEPFSQFSKLYKKAQIGIWWLSVDNYFSSELKNSLKNRWGLVKGHRSIPMMFHYNIKDKRVINLTASQYAYDFLINQGITAKMLVEPLGLTFIQYMKQNVVENENKRNVVFYNPKKGTETTKKIIGYCSDVDFIPIENMSYKEVLDTLRTGKVYMDFGEFPGAERLPKEAVICGCCIITGTKGASQNDVDVCIPRKYKYEHPLEHIEEIHNQILDFYENYEERRVDFVNYYERVMGLEDNFKKAIKDIFKGM